MFVMVFTATLVHILCGGIYRHFTTFYFALHGGIYRRFSVYYSVAVFSATLVRFTHYRAYFIPRVVIIRPPPPRLLNMQKLRQHSRGGNAQSAHLKIINCLLTKHSLIATVVL